MYVVRTEKDVFSSNIDFFLPSNDEDKPPW